MNFNQEIEICIKNCRLARFIIYFQIFNQNFIWSRMIYIACFLKSRNQWVCNSINCARSLRAIMTNAISKIMIVSYNSRYVISQCDDQICFRNDQIRDFQIYTCSRKLFASIFDFDSRFSILENFSFNFNLQTLSRLFRHLFV